MYFLNGFIKDNIMEDILKSFFKVTPETMNSYTTINDFINNEVHYVSVKGETDLDKIILFLPFFDFLKPQDYFAIPMLYQFILLEFAMDVLKIAGLNTPSSLGSTISLIGGLILGEYTIKTGWFTNQSILYMAIVTLGDFIQPSIEMNFAVKFARMVLLVLCGFFGFWGFMGGIIFIIIIMANTKTIARDKYFYPLIPFNWEKLRNLLFRTRISNDVQ